jgi:type IV secretory pathway TraG/TraD family ATPase VirD4
MLLADALEQLTRGGNANVNGRTVRKAYRPFWMALDEIAAFKRLAEIEIGSGFFRGYGVYLFLIFQSLAQLLSHYGMNEVLSETTGMRLFGRPERFKGAEEIEKELGHETVILQRRSKTLPGAVGSGTSNWSIQENTDVHRVPLLTAKQIMQIEDDRLIALTSGKNFYLLKFPFFANKALRERSKRKHVCKPPDGTVTEPIFIHEAHHALGDEKWNRLQEYIAAKEKAGAVAS